MEPEPRISPPAHATGAVEFVPLAEVAADATFRLREEGDVAALAASIGRLGQLVPVELRPLPGAGDDGPRYQVVAGFRRIAALRMLLRGRVLARVHVALSDEDAWGLALGQALLTEPLDRDGLRALRERLQAAGTAPWADELVEEAMVRAPVEPELRERFFEFLSAPAASFAAPAVEAPLPAAGDDHGDDHGEAAAEAGGAEAGAREGGAASEAAEAREVTPEELVAELGGRLYEVSSDLAVAVESWPELPAEGRRAILEQVRWMAELLPHLEGKGEG